MEDVVALHVIDAPRQNKTVRIVHVVTVGGRGTNGIAFHDALTGIRLQQLNLGGLVDEDVHDENRGGRRWAVHRERSGRRTDDRGLNRPFARHGFAALGQGTQKQFNVNRGPDHRERVEVLVSVVHRERCVDRGAAAAGVQHHGSVRCVLARFANHHGSRLTVDGMNGGMGDIHAPNEVAVLQSNREVFGCQCTRNDDVGVSKDQRCTDLTGVGME